MVELDATLLKQICKAKKLYSTPELNDVLYIHFAQLTSIKAEDLGAYTSVKAIHSEGNALTSTQGFQLLPELTSLFLHENAIDRIEQLSAITTLKSLNLSKNNITSLSSEQDFLPAALHTLLLANNRINSLHNVRLPPTLSIFDITNNQLANFDELLVALKQAPELRVLYVKGNPCIAETANVRKILITALPQLTYLDDRPIFEEERRLAMAWQKGGLDEERNEKRKMKEEKDNEHIMQMEAFKKLINERSATEVHPLETRTIKNTLTSNSKILIEEITDNDVAFDTELPSESIDEIDEYPVPSVRIY